MQSKKIITIAVSAILILGLAGVGIYGITNSNDGTDPTSSTADAVSTTDIPSVSDTTTQVSTTAAPDIRAAILGKWTDSANMSGYHFYEDGTVEMTYVNLTIPVINIPINGTSKGVYSIEGDKLTTKFSIYSATIENTYTVMVENNTLTMFNVSEGEKATYARAVAEEGTTAEEVSATVSPEIDETEIVGSWISGDGTVSYSFSKDGTMSFTLDGDVFTGVYMAIGDEVTIQYTAGRRKVTEKYTYKISKNSLSLEDGKDTTILIRRGTQYVPSAESELLGKWRDGADMSGYEFLEGGVAKITYVNLTIPVINMPINGTFTGSYTVNGDKLTVNFTIYGNAITDSFTFSVKDNVLSLIDAEGENATYFKK